MSVIIGVDKTFKVSKQEYGAFKYIDLDIIQTPSEIFIDQRKCINDLKLIKITRQRMLQKDDELTSEEKKNLRSLCDQLLWVTSQSRPDCAFDSCYVSNYGKNPTVHNLNEANKALKKLKMTNLGLTFPNLGNPENLSVVVYGDATHASLPSGASQGAHIVFLCGNGLVSPITWRSKKLDRVTKSPLASETMALSESADAGYFVASMVKELFNLNHVPAVTCKTDNHSLKEHLESTKIIQDLRLRVDIARLREMI